MSRNLDLPRGVRSAQVRAEGIGDLLGSPFGSLPDAAPRLRVPSPSIEQLLGRSAGLRTWPGLASSLSLFVPGAGHLLRGERTMGLFFVSVAGFFATLAWALVVTLDRLVGTLRVLGQPAELAFWGLGLLYLLTAVLHVGSALNSIDPSSAQARAYHPVLPGLASAAVPGWGQLLNGHRIRAGLFLGGLWIAGGVWLATSPFVIGLLNAYLPTVSALERAAREPSVVWGLQFTLPILVWVMATYDAASSALHRR